MQPPPPSPRPPEPSPPTSLCHSHHQAHLPSRRLHPPHRHRHHADHLHYRRPLRQHHLHRSRRPLRHHPSHPLRPLQSHLTRARSPTPTIIPCSNTSTPSETSAREGDVPLLTTAAAGVMSDIPSVILAARQRGFAVAVGYRLSAASSYSTEPHILFPAQMYDAASAVRWLRFNASVGYRLDGSRFVGGLLRGWSPRVDAPALLPAQAITAANNHGTPSAAWVHSLNDANAAAHQLFKVSSRSAASPR